MGRCEDAVLIIFYNGTSWRVCSSYIAAVFSQLQFLHLFIKERLFCPEDFLVVENSISINVNINRINVRNVNTRLHWDSERH